MGCYKLTEVWADGSAKAERKTLNGTFSINHNTQDSKKEGIKCLCIEIEIFILPLMSKTE